MNTQINDLKIKAATIIEQARSKLNEADNATAERAAEITAEVDRMFADADALSARASQAEELEKREAAINAADPRRQSETRGIKGADKDREVRAAEAFDAYMRGAQLSSEQRSLLASEVRTGQNTTEATKGGYLVPATLSAAISSALSFGRPMLDSSVVNLITTSSGAGYSIPHAAAGQKGRRLAEGAAAVRNELVFDRRDLTTYKYTSDFIPVTAELLEDAAYDLNAFIATQTGELVGNIVNEDMTRGTGSSMPNGVVAAAGTPAVTTAASLTVSGDDLINLTNAVGAQYHRNASFMLNQQTLGAIRKLKDSNGNYLWTQGFGGLPNQIMGFNYVVNPEFEDMGANKASIAFGDFKKYTVRAVGSPSVRRADELGLGNNEVLFILFSRYAGNLIDTSAVKTLKIKA